MEAGPQGTLWSGRSAFVFPSNRKPRLLTSRSPVEAGPEAVASGHASPPCWSRRPREGRCASRDRREDGTLLRCISRGSASGKPSLTTSATHPGGGCLRRESTGRLSGPVHRDPGPGVRPGHLHSAAWHHGSAGALVLRLRRGRAPGVRGTSCEGAREAHTPSSVSLELCRGLGGRF